MCANYFCRLKRTFYVGHFIYVYREGHVYMCVYLYRDMKVFICMCIYLINLLQRQVKFLGSWSPSTRRSETSEVQRTSGCVGHAQQRYHSVYPYHCPTVLTAVWQMLFFFLFFPNGKVVWPGLFLVLWHI